MMEMKYLFVFSEGGWWLKIDSVEKLIDYHEKIGGEKFGDALLMYMEHGHPSKILEALENDPAKRIEMMMSWDFKYLQAAVMLAEQGNGKRNIFDGFRCLNMESGMSELKVLREYGAVYINPAGGHTFSLEYTQFCHRKELVFPDFKESDIRVKKFQGGSHYYAFIGDMQVRNGDQMKWNTHEAAYQMARSILEA